MEENQEKKKINNVIREDKEYKIHRTYFNNKPVYYIKVAKKNIDGTTLFGKKRILFKTGVDIPDQTKIKILSGFETFYNKVNQNNPKAPWTIFMFFVTDFEIVSQPDEVINQAYNEFNQGNNNYSPF